MLHILIFYNDCTTLELRGRRAERGNWGAAPSGPLKRLVGLNFVFDFGFLQCCYSIEFFYFGSLYKSVLNSTPN